MNPILRNILAFIAGIIQGSLVNLALITIGPMIILPPEGADLSTDEGLISAMPLMEPRHFIFPFLAHALGTLCGAWLCAKIAVGAKMKLAIGVGVLFLIGGIMAVNMIPAPIWYDILDLTLAYIPMAYLGGKLAIRK